MPLIARTDVYALGVLLFRLLCGRLPLEVEGRPLSQVLQTVREVDPTPFAEPATGPRP